MAVKNTDLGGTDWTDNQVLSAVDLNDTFDVLVPVHTAWHKQIVNGSSTVLSEGILKLTSLIWLSVNTEGAGTIHRTTDGGATWTANGTYTSYATGAVCKADATKVMIAKLDGTVYISSNSGATFTVASTPPPAVNTLRLISWPTSSVVVAAGQKSGGTDVSNWYSTDGGDTWTQSASGPEGTEVQALDMLDATHGICVGQSGNVWITTDGGVNWTDTGDDLPNSSDGGYLTCTSRSTDVISYEIFTGSFAAGNAGNTYFASGDTDSEITIRTWFGSSLAMADCGGYVEATNGYYYAWLSSSDARGSFLIRSKDSGLTWVVVNSIPYAVALATSRNNVGMVWEGAANTIYMCTGVLIYKFDRTRD